MSTIDMSDIIENAIPYLWEGVFSVFKIALPFIEPIIISGIVIYLIKCIASKVIYELSIPDYTHRQAKRRAKKACDIIDLASALNDINDFMKNKMLTKLRKIVIVF